MGSLCEPGRAPLPEAGNGRGPYPLDVVLRIHFMQQRFDLPGPIMEESLYDSTLTCNFAKLLLKRDSISDETVILNLLHLLDRSDIAADAL